MKILRVINSVDPHSGGPIEGLKQASQIMIDAGVEVEVACVDQKEVVQQEIEKMPWPVHAAGPSKFGVYSYAKRLAEWLECNVKRFDAVIIHGCWQYHGFATAKACVKERIPYYVYPHGMLDPWFNEAYPLKKIKKMLYWSWGEHYVLSKANAVLFTCEEECRLARKSFRPYKVREHVIGYGTSVPELDEEATSAFTRPTTRPYFVFLGRIQEKKGVDLLVEAYAGLKDAYSELPDLVIAGPEQQPEYAAELKERFPSDSIHWIGPVDSTQKWPLLQAAAALALVSHQENFGLVVAESLAMGTPVLISDKVNIWREIADAKAGIVATDTLEGARILLERWVQSSPEDIEKMQGAATQVFHDQFDIRNATLRLIDFLNSELIS